MSQLSGDPIQTLPVNPNAPLNQDDQALVRHIFEEKISAVDTGAVAKYLKQPLLVAGLIAFLSIPPVDRLIEKIVPAAGESLHYKLMIKAVLGAILFYLLNNWALARS